MLKKPVTKAKRITRTTLRSALVSAIKLQTGRTGLAIADAPKVASRTINTVPIEERAGFPVMLAKGAVHPRDWATVNGVKIEVDFSRSPFLPDTWGQGVKTTLPNSRTKSDGTSGGGMLTAFVAPDGKVFFHRKTSQKYAGFEFTREVGWNGQVRNAQLQARQAIHLARTQFRDSKPGAPGCEAIGVDTDASFFKILSPAERRHLAPADELYFAVVSARRATKLEGVRDIYMVQSQLVDAGVTPTWYVDADSLKDYKALGLKAVVGGKLTAARNKALQDAQRLGKVCVQCSDDISAWEYREGPSAKVRSDDAMNAAHSAARRFIVSPVAAARFVLAKMRAADGPKPMLGGVYPLGSCARTFCGDAFGRRHFIIGDFFVVEPGSKVRFDEEMRLKEDYDFTCGHLKAYGAVLRCNRLTLNVKHYANVGGACSNRDSKGTEEQRNIAILKTKWPGAFSANPKRKNEVILRWKAGGAAMAAGDEHKDDADDDDELDVPSSMPGNQRSLATTAKKSSGKKSILGQKTKRLVVRRSGTGGKIIKH